MPPAKKPTAAAKDKKTEAASGKGKAAAAKPEAKKAAAKPAAKAVPAKKAAAKPAPRTKARDTIADERVETAKEAAETAAEQLELEAVTSTSHAHVHTHGDHVHETDEDAKTRIAIALPPLTEEEQQLSELYSGELNKPATAHGEFTDRQTADEDRPMTPEINARDERKNRWQDRRDQRRQRRDQRGGGGGGGGNQQHAGGGGGGGQQGGGRDQRPREDRPQGQSRLPPLTTVPSLQLAAPTAPAQVNGNGAVHANGAEIDPHARVGTPLGDAAASVFAQLRNGQPMPVRQLAQMMRKRSLVNVDPEQLWPQLKAELLGDERSYRALGLRPRIVYRGRDLFGPGPVAVSQTADAEAGVAVALSRLAGATHRALAARIANASPPGFERIIHAYLVGAGYRDIEWVKRLSGISYASATAPGIERTVLISARGGSTPIDRRGIGELRVGVEAKNLVAGILFSAGELSEDAERELERAGRSIAVMCGDQLVAALIAVGVGVVSSAAPLHYVDDQLLDELLAG